VGRSNEELHTEQKNTKGTKEIISLCRVEGGERNQQEPNLEEAEKGGLAVRAKGKGSDFVEEGRQEGETDRESKIFSQASKAKV